MEIFNTIKKFAHSKLVILSLLVLGVTGIFAIEKLNFSGDNQKSQTHENDSGEIKRIDSVIKYLDERSKNNLISGAVLVAKNGTIILNKAYGMANKRFKVPNRPYTKFNLGSLSKTFTAVAILQLVENNKIGIDDNIGKYLDFFPKNISEKVTIRQLLTMTSGWGDYWQNKYYIEHKSDLRTLPEYMNFIREIPLDFEPGSKWQHSNIGFEVAGAVIEKVTGIDYYKYIREKIYKPSGMTSSDSYDRDAPIDNLATGYTNSHGLDAIKEGWQWENTYFLSPRGTPAGGGYSTTEDILKFDNAFRSGKLIGKNYINFINNGLRGNIGDLFNPQRILKSAGATIGVSTFLASDWKNGYTIIVLSNIDGPAAIEAGEEIIKVLGIE